MSINNNRQVISLITSLILFFSLGGNANAVICLEFDKAIPKSLSFETLKCQSTQTVCCESLSNIEEQRPHQSASDCEECLDISTSSFAFVWNQDRDEHQDVSPIINELSRNEVIGALTTPQRSSPFLKQTPPKNFLLETLQITVLLI